MAFIHSKFEAAFQELRNLDQGKFVIEPRHESWNTAAAFELLHQQSIDRVFADPSRVWPFETFDGKLSYVRLHGTPRTYYSSYSDEELAAFLALVSSDGWCVFDNTASGAAAQNALTMLKALETAAR